MRPSLKKTLFTALPVAGLLALSPAAVAHDCWKDSQEHAAIHDEMGRLHDDFHQLPHSRKEHRRFHKALKREHKRLDRQVRRSWDRERYDRYGYEGPYSEDPYDGRAPYDRSGYGQPPYYGNPYGYGGSPSYGGGSYPGPYSGGPESLIPALLGSLLYGR
jgi:hypothetical protein